MKLPYFSSRPLTQADERISRLVVVVHGTNRNADDYAEGILAAATQAGVQDETLIIAPQFLREQDIQAHDLTPDYLYWTNDGWKEGDASLNSQANPESRAFSSYEVIDQLVENILVSGFFNNIREIVFVGHSAGGQFVNRYAAANPFHADWEERYDISIRYVVANPSSYLYFNHERQVPGYEDLFTTPSANSCPAYNYYKYGLEFLNQYMNQVGEEKIREQYPVREVVYLLGEEDNEPNGSNLDTSCEAMLQGAHRLERGQVYFNYLQHYFGEAITEKHQLAIVPGVGHSHSRMFNSVTGRSIIFSSSVLSVTDEIKKKEEVLLYPNPAWGKVKLILSEHSGTAIKAVRITDMQGKLIQYKVLNAMSAQNNTFIVDIDGLPEGIFLLNIMSGKHQIWNKKLQINEP